MNKRNVSHRQELQLSNGMYIFLLADAIIYCLIAHQCADAALLAHDGLFSRAAGVAIITLCVTALLGLERRHLIVSKTVTVKLIEGNQPPPERKSHAPLIFATLNVALLLCVFVWLPLKQVATPVHKGVTYLFLPLEWHKFLRNYVLLWRLTPGGVVAFALAFALAVRLRLMSRRVRFWLAAAIFCAFFLLVMQSLAVVNFDAKKNLSFFFYPLLAAAPAAVFGKPRLFCRLAAAGGAFALVGMFYIGLVPLKFAFGDAVAKAPYIEKVFDPRNSDSDIAPMFFREMTVDPDGRFLYISYGPTSGIVKIDIRRKRLDSIIHIPGMMRFLWDGGGNDTGQIAGLDWLHADLHIFDKKPFRLSRTVDLLATDPTPSPFDFDIDTARGRMYIVNYELSGITTYTWPGMKKAARSDFKKQGITPMDSGGQRIALDRARNKIYAVAGWTDWRQNYLILTINPDTLAIENKLQLPTAGLELSYCEQTGKLYSVDFYGNTLYEIEVPNLKVTRTLNVPLSSRNVVCDPKRDAIYATGYADGMFAALDYATGKTLARFAVGAKPSSMALLPEKGLLFIGSGAGILKIDVEKMLKSK